MKQNLFVFGALVALIVFITYISSASAQSGPDFGRPIKCYQCNSFYDKGCADFFDNKTYPLIPCSSNATMCRKIIQETYYDGTWDVRYIRQCAMRGEVGPEEGRWCKERSGNFRVKVKYCHCDNKDGCNTAALTSLHHVSIVPLALFVIFLMLSWLRLVT